MLKRVGAIVWCAAALTGCSCIMGPPDQRPPDPSPQPLPPVKQIIANSTDVIFDASSDAKNVAISELRRFDSPGGSEFGVCLRATVTNKTGKNTSTVIYVVTVARNRISDRRKALAVDGCDKESYQPL
jgi:hypothetical protein